MQFILKRTKNNSIDSGMESCDERHTISSNSNTMNEMKDNNEKNCSQTKVSFVPRKKTNFIKRESTKQIKIMEIGKEGRKGHTDKHADLKKNKNKIISRESAHQKDFEILSTRLSKEFNVTYQKIEFIASGTKAYIELNIKPSDPEFPYELETLGLKLCLSPEHQFQNLISVKVLNDDIPRPFAVNIENALMQHSYENKNFDLVKNLMWLDSNLTEVLKRPEATIIKFVRRNVEINPVKINDSKQEEVKVAQLSEPKINSTLTSEEQSRRQREITQIERRFRKSHKVISQDNEKYIFEVKLEPSDPDFKFRKDSSYYFLTITVPVNYPQLGSTITLKIVCGRNTTVIKDYMLRNIEYAFNEYASKSNKTTILHCVNWLDTRIESLLLLPPKKEDINLSSIPKHEVKYIPTPPKSPELIPILYKENKKDDKFNFNELFHHQEHTHIDIQNQHEETTSEHNDNKEEINHLPPPTSHTGLQIRFPNYTMANIALLNTISIEFEVQCNRCKARLLSPKLNPHCQSFFKCAQCNHNLALRFRNTLIHEGTDALGYLDSLECWPINVTKVSVAPTCAKCDNYNGNLNAFKNVLPTTVTSDVCRTCHIHFSLELNSPKFIRLAPSANTFTITNSEIPKAQLLGIINKKEKLNIQVGTPLPNFGTCQHYRKSYRWLRFPCCGLAFACDTCHDQHSDHIFEYATSTICGYCSRETNYFNNNNNICRSCGHDLIHSSKGKAFWEGGKGTRDKSKMNRNEQKKYNGLNKTVSRKKQDEAKI